MNAKQHGRIWKWIQGNLEIYRILEGGIDTSPVEKNYYGMLVGCNIPLAACRFF